MKRGPVTAVAIAANLEHVEALPWLSCASHRTLNTDELRKTTAAVEDGGARLVSLAGAQLEAVVGAVDSVRELARACRAAELEASR